MLLEALVVSHQPALHGSFDVTSTLAQILVRTVKNLILAQLAFERAVVERSAQRRLQPYGLKTLLSIAQYPGIVAYKLMLELLANHLVQTQEVRSRDTLAIWRIGYDESLLARLGEILEILQDNIDVLAQTSSLHIVSGNLHGLTVVVVAVDVVLELTLATVVIVYAAEELSIKVRPLLESILLAEHTWRDTTRYECSLDSDSTAATHGVNQVALSLPTRLHDNASSQNLVERSLDSLLTVATAMQTLTRRVQSQSAVIFCYMDMKLYIRIRDAYVGTLTRLLAKLVDYSILHLVRHKLGVAKLVGKHYAIYGKRRVVGKIFRPVNSLDSFVYLISTHSLEMLDRLEYTDSRTQLEISAIHHLFVTSERHHATSNLNIVGTKVDKLSSQYGLQTLKSFGD